MANPGRDWTQFRLADLFLWMLLTSVIVALASSMREGAFVVHWLVAAAALALCVAGARGANEQWSRAHLGAWTRRLAYWTFVISFVTPVVAPLGSPILGWGIAVVIGHGAIVTLVGVASMRPDDSWIDTLSFLCLSWSFTLANLAALGTPWMVERPRWARLRVIALCLGAAAATYFEISERVRNGGLADWHFGYYLWFASLWVLTIEAIWARRRRALTSQPAPIARTDDVAASP